MDHRTPSIGSITAGLLAATLLLGCNGLLPDADTTRQAASRESAARESRDDPGLEQFARESNTRPYYFPMMITDEGRFSIEIEEDLSQGGVAMAGFLRDVSRDDHGYRVVLSDAFGTHIVELETSRDALDEILALRDRDRGRDARYFVAAKIRRVTRPIVDVIREEDTMRVEGGQIVPPTVYRGSLVQIARAD